MIKFSPLNSEINIFNKYTSEIKQMLVKNINKESFVVPTLFTFLREFSGFRDTLITNYNSSYPYEKSEGVSVDVKVYQSAMDEGIVFAYNLETQKLSIYTSRIRTLNLIDKQNKFDKEKTLEKNLKGIVHCMRLDVSYIGNDETDIELKATTKDKITPETHVLIPFLVFHLIEKLIEHSFKKGRVLKITQNLNGVLKERFLTENPLILANHNENGSVIANESWYFSGCGYFYAPVLGAPSNTSGMSRVDILNIEKIQLVEGTTNLCEVAKSSNEALFAPQIFSWILRSLIDKDEQKARQFLNLLCRLESVKSKVANIDTEDIQEYKDKVLKATSLLTESELEEIKSAFSLIYLDRLEHYRSILKEYQPIAVPETLEQLERLLKTGAYKITLITSGSKLSVVYCTNNSGILRKLYGDDFDTKFESVGNRIRKVNKLLEANPDQSMGELLVKYNLPIDCNLEPPEIRYEKEDFVRVRLLFSPYTEKEVIDFYRTIKLERIVSIAKIG